MPFIDPSKDIKFEKEIKLHFQEQLDKYQVIKEVTNADLTDHIPSVILNGRDVKIDSVKDHIDFHIKNTI